MASTVLPNGIIIPEKYSRDWYNDLYHNWQELDNLLGGGANDGTLTIQKNGTTVGTFSANQATDETVNIEVPDVNNGTLTIQKNGTTVDTFTANSSTDKTVDITVPTKTSDLANDSGFITEDNTKIPLAGSNQISGSLIPSTDGTVNLGGSNYQWNNAYIKSLTINGVACGDILTHNASEFVPRSGGAVSGGLNFSSTWDYASSNQGWFPNTFNWLAGNRNVGYIGIYDDSRRQIVLNVLDHNGVMRSVLSAGIDASNNIIAISNNKNIAMQEDTVPRSGGAVMEGINIARTVNNSYLRLFGGTNESDGAYFQLAGNNAYSSAEFARIVTGSGIIYYFESSNFAPSGRPSLGAPDYEWGQIYSTNSAISTSDARFKNSVKDIDDKLLDAWGNIEPKQYKFNDATEKKGDNARLHTGYIAQNIQAECEKQGINASDYGLFCYDEWEEQEEISEEIETEKDGKKVKEKRVIQPKREKGNSYALRYEEALVVECKYLRRCVERLTARIEELEKGNNTK